VRSRITATRTLGKVISLLRHVSGNVVHLDASRPHFKLLGVCSKSLNREAVHDLRSEPASVDGSQPEIGSRVISLHVMSPLRCSVTSYVCDHMPQTELTSNSRFHNARAIKSASPIAFAELRANGRAVTTAADLC
jgi:hypothetical protein